MSYQLLLNEQVLKTGDVKSINSLFNDLSGLGFRNTQGGHWLDKMSAVESYQTYLNIKAIDLGVESWLGRLIVRAPNGSDERVHLFATHQKQLEQVSQKSQTGKEPSKRLKV